MQRVLALLCALTAHPWAKPVLLTLDGSQGLERLDLTQYTETLVIEGVFSLTPLMGTSRQFPCAALIYAVSRPSMFTNSQNMEQCMSLKLHPQLCICSSIECNVL